MDKVGFVKVSRKVTEWSLYKDPNAFKLFMHILLCSDWSGASRGCLRTNVRELSYESGLSEKEVRTAMKKLSDSRSIEIETNRKGGSVISVVNYDEYQGEATSVKASSPPSGSKAPAYNKRKGKTEKEQSYDITEYERNTDSVPEYKPRQAATSS